jgi:hypothetical protein
MIDSVLEINIACENVDPFGLRVISHMESGCSNVPGSEFGCTVDPGGFYPGFGCSSILGVYQLEVGLDLLIWRILSSVSSDAYLEHYP